MDGREQELGRLAAVQHGVVSRSQARTAGMTADQIDNRVTRGRWLRLFRGAYRMSGTPETWQQRGMAACLAAPEGAVLSHLWAAALHGLVDDPPPMPDVTVRRGRSTRLAGANVHLARQPVVDVVVVDGIPCTSVARTLIDCAGVLGRTRLRRIVERALHRKLVRPEQIPPAWDRARIAPGRHGERKLRRVLAPWHGAIEAGSPAEVRLRRMVTDWGFPAPTPQVRVVDAEGVIGRVDLAWPGRRIAIEYDSDEFHGPERWAADERRHQRIVDEGWVLLRADKDDLRPGRRDLRRRLERAWRAAEPGRSTG